MHGGCPQGADAIADEIWRSGGGRVERHSADWQRHGRRAGIIRNIEMAAASIDICLAFIHDHSPGATHCADEAERQGVRVERHLCD